MNGLWIILLDKSGSMAGPFQGTLKFQGDIEYGPETSKIESAKRRLIKEINGLSSVEVVVIGFDSSADVVVRGSSDDVQSISKKVEQIEAGGGTDIGAALRLAAVEATRSDSRPKTILLISDGLSSKDDAIGAAVACRDAGLIINTILIDPTEEGNALAKAISIGGWVRAVGSETQAETAMSDAAAPYRAHPSVEPSTQPSAAAPESPFPKLITVIASCLGVFGAATGLASSSLDKPSLFPWALGIVLLAACPLLLYIATARLIGPSLYKSPTELYEPTYYKYGAFKRVSAMVGATLLLFLAAATFKSGWEGRKIIQVRLANETDRIIRDVELAFIAVGRERYDPETPFSRTEAYGLRSYFGSIKAHEATPYRHFNEVDLLERHHSDPVESNFVALRTETDSRRYFSRVALDGNPVEWRAFRDSKYTCVIRKDLEYEEWLARVNDPKLLPEESKKLLLEHPYGLFTLACSRDGGY